MKISPVSTINARPGLEKAADSNSKKTLLEKRTEAAADKFVPSSSNQEKITTYNRQTLEADSAIIASLKKESEKAYESLRQIVTELLERQGYSARCVWDGEAGVLEIDETARTEAAALIAEDGPLGAEAVSDRIVNFALALSKGDKARLPEIKEAIEKGFGQAKNMLGDLPEISHKTYDLIMEKLERWENEVS